MREIKFNVQEWHPDPGFIDQLVNRFNKLFTFITPGQNQLNKIRGR